MSKVSNSQPHADFHTDTTKSDVESTNLSQEIECWEETYRERFARSVKIPASWISSTKQTWFTFDPLWGMVSMPLVRKLSLEDVERDIKYIQRFKDCSPRYEGPTPEPLSAELRARTKHELVHSFGRSIGGHFRENVRHLWLREWESSSSSSIPVTVSYLKHGDALRPELFRKDFLGTDILSKITAVYFEPGFMQCFGTHGWETDEDPQPWPWYGRGCGYIARAMLAAWEEVHYYNGELANRQQRRWLANAVALEGDPGPLGATEGAIRTHKVICEELENAQNKPVSSEDPYTWVEHGFELGPIYRSVIILLDKQVAFEHGRGEDQAETCDILFERCSVLLVCTGDEDHLSVPVDFSTLTAAGLTLPLDRSEAALIDQVGTRQVVRVRLRTAVRFVMDLERREINASPHLTARKNVLDADMLRKAESWAEEKIAHAESHGSIDRDPGTWKAVRVAQAHIDGDRCGLEYDPVDNLLFNLRYW